MSKTSTIDRSTQAVEKALSAKYLPRHPRARITVYRYNSGSIRVRIIDSQFDGNSIMDRETDVMPIIRELSDQLQDQITMLLLLSPKESERSQLSAEFDNPTRSCL